MARSIEGPNVLEQPTRSRIAGAQLLEIEVTADELGELAVRQQRQRICEQSCGLVLAESQ